jgi:hypothetical protein
MYVPGAILAIMSCNASALNSLVHFDNDNIFLLFKKTLESRYNIQRGIVVVTSEAEIGRRIYYHLSMYPGPML